ncbi:4Fe-4S ferredoxin [Bacteroidia bacterium]|nr:4Fe-4S ferredoxin [Bacteroidia bacterium]
MITENKHRAFLEKIERFIPRKRIYTDELRRLAWGTDAGFYRLIPQIVIRSTNEQEVSKILAVANRLQAPVTFRAAGTSLSGQAISDSILIVAGKNWEKYSIAPDAKTITLQPGIIGERVNEILKSYGRKFSPDPASVKSAMVGGIVMNNASGMNCGTHANSDRVLLSARMVFADGTILDTGDAESRLQFARNKSEFIRKIETIRDKVRNDKVLSERIRHKYSIKNVVGLNILPFISYDDPFDITAHLLVGSEGTLAFLSEVTMKTEYDFPHKASAMLYFTDIKEACRAVVAMKKLTNERGEWIVKGAELLDEKSLQSVNDPTGKGLTAVLTETKAATQAELEANIAQITDTLHGFQTYIPIHFTDKESEYSRYWAIRAGIFPSVGGTRQPGTTTLIEDVAFHIEDLPEATADLQQLLAQHGYDDACIYGHALEGNYHFIINQSFDSETEVKRYDALMNDVIKLVVEKYDGSLKAEHGTGRNMAPFVKYEWGEAAYEIMREVKQLFDPHGLLNPGVIFNDDPRCHIKNFKPLPLTNPKVDKCIECGFCEVNCLTCGFSLSSRQRIVLQREITRLKKSGENPKRLQTLQKQYRYLGNQTCAGDGLCALSCPMNINTGDLTHDIREAELPKGSLGYNVGDWTAKNLKTVKKGLRPVLTIANAAHTVLGTKTMSLLATEMHRYLYLPLWTPAMPLPIRRGAHAFDEGAHAGAPLRVVYFPSCINQTMGLEKKSPEKQPLVNKMLSLLRKAGYEVIFPKNMDNLCCGTIWESKGMMDIADRKSAELEAALYEASEQGKYPVLCDQSPCLYRMRHTIKTMKLYEPVEFITTFLLDKLTFTQTDTPVAVHITCSMRKMGLANHIIDLAKRCSTKVLIPEEVGCCGFAGDKGFTQPEVNAYALRKLRPQIEKAGITMGYSNSRTCEIGLTTNSGIPYQSIVYLVDECTNLPLSPKGDSGVVIK